jgi:hypothetical protein
MIDDIIRVVTLANGTMVIEEIPAPPPLRIPWAAIRPLPGLIGCLRCFDVYKQAHGHTCV